MRRLLPVLIVTLAALLAGCSSISYNYDFDQDADFTTYKTYNWGQRPDPSEGGAAGAAMSNDLAYRRIQGAVDETLQSKGLLMSDTPDLIVAVHTGVQDKVDVQSWGYGYGYPYYGYGGRDIQVYNYKEGTLIVDLVDRAAMELVWRTSATGTMDSNPNPQKTQEKVGPIIERMFRDYPMAPASE